MQQQDIFNELNMSEFIWGDAFIFTINDIDLSVPENRFQKLDEICELEGWNKQGEAWESFSFKSCAEMLLDAIQFDMAYSSYRITPVEKAQQFHKALLKGFKEGETFCYSNWVNNMWRPAGRGGGWNPLTENTFDIGLVFVSANKILFNCFRSED